MEKFNSTKILEAITDPQASSFIAELMTTKYGDEIDRQKLIEDCLVLLKRRRLETVLSNLENEIKIAQEQELDAAEYTRKYLEYRAEIKKIESKAFLKNGEA